MKRIIYIVTCLVVMAGCSCRQVPDTGRFRWHQAYTGGGGYITGFVQDPFSDSVFYARCDVAGVFKSRDGGRSWTAVNAGMSKWYHHSVRSIAVHPRVPGLIFRGSGDMRNDSLFGSIHKSEDGGFSWREVCREVPFFGNGPTRQYGETVMIDPCADSVVIAAGYGGGIWKSRDYGERWYSVKKAEDIFTCMVADTVSGVYYAATDNGRLWSSPDRGETWELRYETKAFGFRDLVPVGTKDGPVLYASTGTGVFKSADGGRHFVPCMKGLPEGCAYIALTVDPVRPEVLYCAPDARPGHSLAPVPVYRTVDGGANWHLIARHTLSDIRNRPSYYTSTEKAGWAVSKIRVDRCDPSRLLFSNWYGVCNSDDGGITYDACAFKGLETCCLEHIQYIGRQKGTVCFTLADHMPMVSKDNGESFAQLGGIKYTSSTAVLFPVQDTGVVLYGGYFRLSEGEGRVRETEGGIVRVSQGKSRIVWESRGAYVQALKENRFRKGEYYAYIDGEADGAGGIYRSTDGGETWKKLFFPGAVKSLPVNRAFIENELLNIVVGQVKNVCGCNQLLETDYFDAHTLYAGERTTGLYKSTDDGTTWTDIGSGLPFGRDTASVLTAVKQNPCRPGVLYAGFIREGLWRSADGGKSWSKIYPAGDVLCNVSSLYVGGKDGNEIVIGGENLYWADVSPAVWYSGNGGQSFVRIDDGSLGALRIKGVDMDPGSGRIFVATSGNGAFYVERE